MWWRLSSQSAAAIIGSSDTALIKAVVVAICEVSSSFKTQDYNLSLSSSPLRPSQFCFHCTRPDLTSGRPTGTRCRTNPTLSVLGQVTQYKDRRLVVTLLPTRFKAVRLERLRPGFELVGYAIPAPRTPMTKPARTSAAVKTLSSVVTIGGCEKRSSRKVHSVASSPPPRQNRAALRHGGRNTLEGKTKATCWAETRRLQIVREK